MQLSDFDYELPRERIAQVPLKDRDASRMLLIDRKRKSIEHYFFKEIGKFINSKDSIFINESFVQKARLLAKRSSGGKLECFVLKKISSSTYECLIKSSAKKENLCFKVENVLEGKVIGRKSSIFIVQFKSLLANKTIDELMEEFGKVPLPPYIHREMNKEDIVRYQTIYAKEKGSIAAPTAGLHFSSTIMQELEERGVFFYPVTLHVGLGTFQEIRKENIEEHKMHSEYFEVSSAVAKAMEETKKRRGRCIAIGTTTARALEAALRLFPEKKSGKAWTDLFLYPGVPFLAVDAMLTNFHQAKSSLLVMLSAFAGRELIMEAYEEAIREKYRFFSYGDCMLIL